MPRSSAGVRGGLLSQPCAAVSDGDVGPTGRFLTFTPLPATLLGFEPLATITAAIANTARPAASTPYLRRGDHRPAGGAAAPVSPADVGRGRPSSWFSLTSGPLGFVPGVLQ